MNKTNIKSCFIVLIALTVPVPAISRAGESAHKEWLKNWQMKNPAWRSLHLIGPQPERMQLTEQFVRESLAPLGINVGLPRAAIDLEEPRCGGRVHPLRTQRRYAANAGHPFYRLVSRRQRREAHGSTE